MPGVALDQNQEIHIRGEHMGIQYQINGILLPLDINNDPTFTQLLNAYFVKSVSLIDGVLPAQYGYRTAGVIDIQTKDGCDDPHNSLDYRRRPTRHRLAEFPVGRMQRKVQLLPDRPLSPVQSRFQLGRASPGPDSRRGHTGAGIRLSNLRAQPDDPAQPDLRHDALVQPIS